MDEQPEWFHSTSGRYVGTAGLVAALAVSVLVLFDVRGSHTVTYVAGALLTALACWAVLLRPRVGLTADTLVLRLVLRTAFVPLAAIESIGVSQVLAVRAGGRRFVSAAIGKPLRRAVMEAHGATPRPKGDDAQGRSMPYVDFVEDRIRDRRAEVMRARLAAAERAGEDAAPDDPGPVRVEPAGPEIAGFVVLGLVFLGSFLL